MKILHILGGTITGGVITLVNDISEYQLRKGNQVDLYSFRKESKYFDKTKIFERLGIKVFKSPSKYRLSPAIIFDLFKILPKYDVVHVHLFPQQFIVNIARLLLPSWKRPRFITTEHSTYNNRRAHPILKYFDRWMYSGYERIICISPQTENNLKNWLNSKKLNKRINIITNGINLKKFRVSSSISNEEFRFAPDQKLIVMVSRMEPPKDPVTLVKAISICPENYHGLFIGDGNLVEDVKKEAEKRGIPSRIHCIGNRTDIPEILKVADVGVLSTKWEGFGLVAVEYMAAGLPCLVSDVDGLKNVVDDSDLLFKYGDFNTLSQKIINLSTNSEIRKAKIINGYAKSKKYSSDVMNENYCQIYSELFGE